MASDTFTITIPNKDALLAALARAPEIARPRLQQAVEKSQAVLAQNTRRGIVPWKTGNLVQTFAPTIGDLWAIWKPTAAYAAYVEFGTSPHVIRPKNALALYWEGADHPIKSVNHPGTKPQDYMGAILTASVPGINQLFNQALDIITQDIANSAK